MTRFQKTRSGRDRVPSLELLIFFSHCFRLTQSLPARDRPVASSDRVTLTRWPELPGRRGTVLGPAIFRLAIADWQFLRLAISQTGDRGPAIPKPHGKPHGGRSALAAPAIELVIHCTTDLSRSPAPRSPAPRSLSFGAIETARPERRNPIDRPSRPAGLDGDRPSGLQFESLGAFPWAAFSWAAFS